MNINRLVKRSAYTLLFQDAKNIKD